MREIEEKKNAASWMFNPFAYLKGWEAFLYGALAISIAGYFGAFSNTHFDGVMDTHTGAAGPWWCFFMEGLIDWLCMGVVLWVLGKMASKTAFRALDLFGTQALARWPTVLVSLACLTEGYVRFAQFIAWKFMKVGEEVPFLASDLVVFLVVVGLMVLMTCWMIYLMYKSYSVSCKITGGKAIGTFVVGIILAEILSKIAITTMLIWVQQDQSWKPMVEESPEVKTEEVSYHHEKIYTFDDGEGFTTLNGDKGLTVGIEGGEFRVHGRTTDSDWGPEAVRVPVIDDGGAIDVSGRFRIETREASGLVFLEAETSKGGPLIYMYQWSPMFQVSALLEAYQIQTRWYKMPARLLRGTGSMRVPGDPTSEFCSMRIHIREDHKSVDFFANGQYQDTVVFEESFGSIVSAKMELQTPQKGKAFDIRFDDLTIKWNDSPKEIARAEMEKKSGGLLLHYTFDEDGEKVKDVSGQECHGTIIGEPKWADGVKGKAMVFDGGAVVVESSKQLRTVQNSDFTIMAWFNSSSPPRHNDKKGFGIVVKPGCDVGLIRDDSGIFRFSRYYHTEEKSTGLDDMKTAWVGRGKTTSHKWYHLVGVVSEGGKKTQLYVNGRLTSEESHAKFVRPVKNNAAWHIGTCDGAAKRWPAHGLIDDVRIYNRAFSGSESVAIYDETKINHNDAFETSVKVLTDQLGSEHVGVRYRASIVLADIGPEAASAVPALTEAAKDIKICAAPVLALGKIGIVNDQITGVIMDALSHESEWDRMQGAIALGRLDVRSAVPELEKLRDNDKNEDVRRHARNAVRILTSSRLDDATSPLIGKNTPWSERKQYDELVMVRDVDTLDGSSVHALHGFKRLKDYEGEKHVIRTHPIDNNTHSVVDFSKVTEEKKGTLLLHVRGTKDHDCIMRIHAGGEMIMRAIVDGNRWQKATVPFDHTKVLLECHPGGPESFWDCEDLFFTYKIVVEPSAEEVKALEELKLRAQAGNMQACADLGFGYLEGRAGCPVDYSAARKWITKSAELGFSWGQVYMSDLYSSGRGFDRDDRKAAEWLKKGVAQNNPEAQVRLGNMYMEGRGVNRDGKKGLELLIKSAEQDYEWGQFYLADAYRKGAGGIPKDPEKAAKWFRKCAEHGNIHAVRALK